MITTMTRKDFESSIIAQDDDNDYSESGYVACAKGAWAALSRYGHCSCYDTFTSLTGGGISDTHDEGDVNWDWQGTPDELVNLARSNGDPAMPKRTVDPKDCDADHLAKVYEQILEWDAKGRP